MPKEEEYALASKHASEQIYLRSAAQSDADFVFPVFIFRAEQLPTVNGVVTYVSVPHNSHPSALDK